MLRLMRLLAVLLMAPVLLWTPPAQAGRRPFTTLLDSEILAEGDVELEQWAWLVRPAASAPAAAKETAWLWWGPVFSPWSRLELSVPFWLVAHSDGAWIEALEVDSHWRLFPREHSGRIQPVLKLAYHHVVGQAATETDWLGPRLDTALGVSIVGPVGLRFVLNAGGRFDLPGLVSTAPPDGVAVRALSVVTYGVGCSLPVLDEELRLSLEASGEWAVSSQTGPARHFLGPTLAWSRGRVWINVNAMVGLTSQTPAFVPRVAWAVAL